MAEEGTILIVDDEQNILSSLRRLFMCHDVDVRTANSAEEALEMLAERPAEFLLCDYKMPDVNGIQLLERVKTLYPDMFRAILSGYVEADTITYAIGRGTAMAYFKKPWTDYDLAGKILHIISTMRHIKDKELLRIFGTIDKLPGIPKIYYEINDAVTAGQSIDRIAGIIKRDTSLTAKVLQIGNSVFYSGKGSATLEQAILMIGLTTIKDMVLMYKISEGLGVSAAVEKELAKIFAAGLVLNKAMEHYLVHSGEKYSKEISGTLGILSRVGRIILLIYHPERYYETVNFAEGTECSFDEAERELGYVTDTERVITCSFLDLYNIPFEILEIILYKGQPEKVSPENRLVAAVYSAMSGLLSAIGKGTEITDDKLESFSFGILSTAKLKNTAYIITEVWNIGK
ncbi:HDOD domain-containing protein [Seleniivibrio woodruffii]|uniref:HDOD domain-containing protein n=1 Tax=Seleniivibrio woodruffii TaxID=1078050 RepID=UPI00240977DF|nr:HDOD domain-containing protein [Seleniivibrio woodruffii]